MRFEVDLDLLDRIGDFPDPFSRVKELNLKSPISSRQEPCSFDR